MVNQASLRTQYTAVLSREGARTLIDFPSCPGCSTFAEADEDVVAVAREALESWLEAHLIDGESPARPAAVSHPRGKRLVPIEIDPQLSARLQIRWAREDLGVTQTELARRMHVPRQQVSRMESSAGNLTIETLARVADALGLTFRPEFVKS